MVVYSGNGHSQLVVYSGNGHSQVVVYTRSPPTTHLLKQVFGLVLEAKNVQNGNVPGCAAPLPLRRRPSDHLARRLIDHRARLARRAVDRRAVGTAQGAIRQGDHPAEEVAVNLVRETISAAVGLPHRIANHVV